MSLLGDLVDGIINFGAETLGYDAPNVFGSSSPSAPSIPAVGGQDAGGGFWDSIMKNPVPALAAGGYAISALNQPGDPYQNSQAYLDQKLQLEKDQLAQQMEIAKMNAASYGSGASAAVNAARIAAASNEKQLAKKLAADRLALKLQVLQGRPELVGQAYTGLTNAYNQRGQGTQAGFGQAANVVASARK